MLLHGVFHLKGRTVLSHFEVVICQIKLRCNIVDELSRIYSLIYFVKCHASFEVLDIICFFLSLFSGDRKLYNYCKE